MIRIQGLSFLKGFITLLTNEDFKLTLLNWVKAELVELLTACHR